MADEKTKVYQGSIRFMPNWYMLFKSRDTDRKKLGFLKTILEYAFEDRIPEVAYRDPSGFTDGEEYAIYDAFWMAKPIIDNYKREQDVGLYGVKGGRPRKENEENPGVKPRGFFDPQNPENQGVLQGVLENGNPGGKPGPFNKIEIENKIEDNYIAGSDAPARTRNAVLDGLFERFWKEYPSTCPRKYDKKKCRDKWSIVFRSASDVDALFGLIMEGLAKWRASKMWNESGGQFIMAPMRWLNGRCWEDTPAEAAISDGGGSNSAVDELAKKGAEALRQMREKITGKSEGVQ